MMKQVLLYFIVFLGFVSATVAQPNYSPERYEIDLKRKDIDRESREALLRSREFIRIDPTYYVGHMMEGLYRYERSSDYIGYKNTIPVLKKALDLFEHDYAKMLSAQYLEQGQFASVEDRFWDHYLITDRLMDCYSNLEQPDSVIWLLNRRKDLNMQYDIMGADNYIAWTYHRNRYYTSDKFSFLKNSIAENEQVALDYLKGSLQEINKKAPLNERALSPNMVLRTKLSVYHYLAIIYDYLQQPDSSRYYYELMSPYNIFPYNNYAHFCYTNGEIAEAYENFEYALYYDRADKMLQESVYFLGDLNVMAGKPKANLPMLMEYETNNKVRPGWGWYNTGMARAYLYSGELDNAAKCIKKAANFKEIHVGTTLGESQYNFAHSLLNLVRIQREIASIKFENKYYWLSFSKLKKLFELKIELSTVRLNLFNQLSANPERDELYYQLFASESTVNFDEIYSLVKDYGRSFFIKKFGTQAKETPRYKLKKYFSLLEAKLYLEKGKTNKAKQILQELINTNEADANYENLYLARLYEASAISENSGDLFNEYRNHFYDHFAQLVPYSKVKMKFYIDVKSEDNSTDKKIIKDLNKFNIKFTNSDKGSLPRLIIRFANNGEKNVVSYKVESAWGKTIISPQTIEYDTPDDIAKKIAYGMFKIGIETNEYDYQ